MLGPLEHKGRKRPLNVEQTTEQPSKKASKSSSSNPESNDLPLADEEALTIEQRLNDIAKKLRTWEGQVEQGVSRDVKGAQPGPSADSLMVLLDQALQSNDNSLLEQCLAVHDGEVIDQTILRLPTQRVLVFLKVLIAKFEKRPSRGLLITFWVLSIIKHHLSYLTSVPDLAGHLAGLSQMLDQRLQAYSRLSSLAGRLDLLMSQSSSRRLPTAGSDSDSLNLNQMPKQVLQEI